MKKKLLAIFTVICLTVLVVLSATRSNSYHSVKALSTVTQSTSRTYAEDIRGHGLSATQDAYLPEKATIGNGLVSPSDIFIDEDDYVYISDSNSRHKCIVILDPITKEIIKTIEHNDFRTPKGIFILNNCELYVADNTAEKVFVFVKNDEGNYEYDREYGRPSSILFAENQFKPSKVSVDRSGNMYIIGETVFDGIIQLSKDGTFLGYFATNKVNKTLKEKMQELIYDDATLELLGSTQPPAFTNVFTDSNGLVYSTTSYTPADDSYYFHVKKHNTSGKDIGNIKWSFSYSPTDIYVGSNNIIYVSWSNGLISSFTESGEVLFVFGGQTNDNIAGLFAASALVGLAVDSHNNIWCIDEKKAAIHKFVPTDYTNLIYESFELYYQRDYQASIAKWKEVLALNQVSSLAHNQLGLNYLYSQNYKEAMNHLKIASDRKNYSQAFWEVRNMWLQENLVIVVLALLLLLALFFGYRQYRIKKGIVVNENGLLYKFRQLKFVQDVKFNMSVLKDPYDSFYYIKTNKKGSTLSCIIMMIIMFFIFLWYTLGKGFIFQVVSTDEVDIVALFTGFFGIIGLLTLCNWLVSSIQDGEGTFLAVFRMIIVSLVPWMISMIVVILLSYVATTNESFILSLIYYSGMALSLIMIFLGIQDVHFYSFKKTIISILLTVLLMFIIILVILLVIILSTKLYQFIEVLIKEAIR